MIAPITFPTAKEFWLKGATPEKLTPISFQKMQPADAELMMRFAEVNQLSLPVHFMTQNPSERYSLGRGFYGHVIPKHLKPSSFIEPTESLYVVSPELCFLLAAKTLSVPELTVLAMNLCAQYRVNPFAEFGLERRTPVTSTAKIKKYLSDAQKIPGLAAARTVIQYSLDNSNSPMESRMAALARLPLCQGGYALLPPKLNYDVKLSAEGRRIMGRDFCCCDMVWPEQRVVVEYDSDMVHMEKDQFYYDKRRATALQLSGQTVVHVTKAQMWNFLALEEIFGTLRKMLGMRAMTDRLAKYRNKRRLAWRQIMRA